MQSRYLSLLFLVALLFGYSKNSFANVDHKDDSVSTYLNNIAENQEEKTQLSGYIEKCPQGVYMDIGTGGDAIAKMLNTLPKKSPVTIIAADVDEHILEEIPQRHPEITPFMYKNSRPYVRLLSMDATNMRDITDNELEGVSASALVHELFSYAPTKTSLDQFFLEITRILKPGGVFIYRDPKLADNPSEYVSLTIKSAIAKYFTMLFVSRFLDRTFSQMCDYKGECCKPIIYENADIKFQCYVKGEEHSTELTLQEFLLIPTQKIDFNRDIVLRAPHGFICEIQRHYVLYLKDIFVSGLLDQSLFKKEFISLSDVSERARAVFCRFAKDKNIPMECDRIAKWYFPVMQAEANILAESMSEGIKIPLDAESKKFVERLQERSVAHEMISCDDSLITVDPKLAVMLFQGSKEGLGALMVKSHGYYPMETLNWLKREGEEYYFYKTIDELITYVGQLTNYGLRGTDKEGYILCPQGPSALKVAPRELYEEVLARDMSVIDDNERSLPIVATKNIIHFSLMKKDEAFAVYKKLIGNNPEQYKRLHDWVLHESE